MEKEYLESIKNTLARYKSQAEKTFEQLNDEQLFWQYNEESNSIAILVKHLWGNMMSRFTDFLTSDGEKSWRKRDDEFENDLNGRKELLQKWNEGWKRVFDTIDALSGEDLTREVFINKTPATVVEALNRAMCHYMYHIGQIVYIGKMALNDKWKTLTIPRKKKH